MSHARTYWITWAFLFLLVLGIVIFRAPGVVFKPSLPFDEGVDVFAHFYEHREAAQILRFKSGYLHLVGNLIGYFAVRFPTRAIPYALLGSAVLITGASYSLFFARCFRRWIPTDLSRAMICLILALAPVGDYLVVTTSDYSLWNLLIILILLTVWRPSAQKGWKFLHGFVACLLIWSHPLAAIIAPLVLWRACKDKTNRAFYRFILFNLIAHQIFGVAGFVTAHGIWDREIGGPIETSVVTKVVDACKWTIQIVPAIAFRAAFRGLSFESVVREGSIFPVIWIVVVIVVSCWLAYQVPRVRSLLAGLAYLIVTLTFLCCFLRYDGVHNDPIGFINYSPRYVYVPSLCFVLLFGTLFLSGWELAWSNVAGWKPAEKCARFSFVPLLVLVCYYGFLNTQIGYYFIFNAERHGPYYDPDPRNGVIVCEFFAKLADQERRNGSRRQIHLVAKKFGDWPIVVDTTISPPPLALRLSHRALPYVIALVLVAFGYLLRSRWIPLIRR